MSTENMGICLLLSISVYMNNQINEYAGYRSISCTLLDMKYKSPKVHQRKNTNGIGMEHLDRYPDILFSKMVFWFMFGLILFKILPSLSKIVILN